MNDENKNFAVIGNDINNAIFKNLTASDMNVFLVCCMYAKDMGTTLVEIPFPVLREKANFRKGSNKDFSEELKALAKKLLDSQIYVQDNNGWAMFNLFQTFRANEDEAVLSIRVSEDWQYALNSIVSNFSQVNYQTYIAIKKKYAKRLYMKLCQYRANGWWKVKIEEFRYILDIPDSCPDRNINSKIIQPALKEMMQYFKYLEVKKEVDMFIFTFDFLEAPPRLQVKEQLQKTTKSRKKSSKKTNKFHNFHEREQDDNYFDLLEQALLEAK